MRYYILKNNQLKVAIVGLGSMGKRRIRNLRELGVTNIVGFDLRLDRCDDVKKIYGIKTVNTFEEILTENPTALIISTPPGKHFEYASQAIKNHIHFFTEADIPDRRFESVFKILKGKDLIAAPSSTMRFMPSIQKLKEILFNKKLIGNPLTFTYHCGQYLPDWHPWEDYRSFYVAEKESGACREIVPFELNWLTWLFGDVNKVICMKDKLTHLNVDIDDVYHLLMKFDTRIIGHMMVDIISRVPYRTCKILSEEGIVVWDWGNEIKVYVAKDHAWQVYKEKKGTTVASYDEKIKEEPYIAEMKCFLGAIDGLNTYPFSFEEEKKLWDVLEIAENSSDMGDHKILSL